MTRRVIIRRLGLAVLVVILGCSLLIAFHRPLLRAAANGWILNTPSFDHVDAVLIPGGGIDTRPFAAAKLFHEGKADRLVVFQTEIEPTVEMGLRPADHQINLKVLEQSKVPAEAIALIRGGVTSTWDEVAAARTWCLENQIHSLAIVTEIFPSRRVGWAYDKGLRDLGIAIHVVTITPKSYSYENWWTSERGLIDFQNEVVKYLFYRIRY